MNMVLIVLCVAGSGFVLVACGTILAIYLINRDYPRDT